jgi:hypothetical protein
MKPSPNKQQESPKKPYNAPQLQVYGNLREITNTVATLGPKTDDFLTGGRTH